MVWSGLMGLLWKQIRKHFIYYWELFYNIGAVDLKKNIHNYKQEYEK